MTSRTMTVRAQLGLLAALSCTVFVLALGGALWQMQIGGARLSGFVDNELAAERDVTRAYAQGLQMGQALRNILLDPANSKAYDNFDQARKDFWGTAGGRGHDHLDRLGRPRHWGPGCAAGKAGQPQRE